MSGMLDAIEGIFSTGDSVGPGIESLDSVSDALSNVGTVETVNGVAAAATGTIAPSSMFPDWAMSAITPVMQTIAGAALRPHARDTAPIGGSGHGVSANAGSNGQVIGQVESLAGGDPLQGLSGFKNLL